MNNTDAIDCGTDDVTPDAKSASGVLVCVCVHVCVVRQHSSGLEH